MSKEPTQGVWRCATCDVHLLADTSTPAIVCNYCGKQFHFDQRCSEDLATPLIIPFKVTKEEYNAAFLEWLVQGDYTPDDILRASVIDQINGIYLPLFLYTGKYDGTWLASAGYDREEEYLAKNPNGNLVNKQRVVTDWRPCNGEIHGAYAEVIFAGKPVNPEIAAFAGGGLPSNAELQPQDPRSYLKSILAAIQNNAGKSKETDPPRRSGFVMQSFSASEDEVWNTHINDRVKAWITAHIETRIPGDRIGDLSCNYSLSNMKSFRIFTPYWIVRYTYQGTAFYFCKDGLTASRVYGRHPVDKNRAKTAKELFFPAHICLASFLVVALILLSVFGNAKPGSAWQDIAGLFCLAVFVTGSISTVLAYLHAKRKKESLLNNSRQKRERSLQNFLAVQRRSDPAVSLQPALPPLSSNAQHQPAEQQPAAEWPQTPQKPIQSTSQTSSSTVKTPDIRVSIRCPSCSTCYKIPAAWIGKRAKCKHCGNSMVIREEG